ncbi:reverse transcriptase domain-containing protein [Tanacetum coccineum]
MYVDGGSASKILYEHCFNRLRPKIKNQLVPATTPLIGFSGEIIWPIGQIQLLVRIRDEEHSASAWMNFMVVRSPSPYNGIIGRPGVKKLQAVPSTAHGMLKLPAEGGVITLKSSRQKRRGQAADRNQAIQEEVGKLMEAEIMKEVHYHDWLSNPVMVKKHDDSWRICVDFKDLNKACPKDGYPLPEIDWKVESLCGFPFKYFLDAYKGYHQIKMAKEDKEKTAFITSQGILCYTKMPFGRRNAGATYQRLVDKAFHKQIGRNLKVYVDDLVIKSRMEDEIVKDIEETFKTLREINMKLNPTKCTFGVEEGMFLGYKVNTKGLKVCPEKVDAVLSLPSPKCLKDVHNLNGKLASLNMFLAKSAEKSLPGIQANEAANSGASHVNHTNRKGGTYRLFGGSQRNGKRGPDDGKRSQTNAHLLCHQGIKWSRNKLHINGKTSVSLDIGRLPCRMTRRGISRYSDGSRKRTPELWILFTDGSSCTDGSGAGLILTNQEGIEFTYVLRFRFDTTNNEAKYEALIAGLRIAEQMGVKNLQANVDS